MKKILILIIQLEPLLSILFDCKIHSLSPKSDSYLSGVLYFSVASFTVKEMNVPYGLKTVGKTALLILCK